MLIGVDESGTGALAGPFTVCALVIHEADSDELRAVGVRDSKRLPERKRRQLITDIADLAIAGCCEVVEAASINEKGKQWGWRRAIVQAVRYLKDGTGATKVCIDGSVDSSLYTMLCDIGVEASFLPKADQLIPVVSAASIVAKTIRTDLMRELHKEFPEYGWDENDGYGTEHHLTALATYGKSRLHRNYKNVVGLPLRR